MRPLAPHPDKDPTLLHEHGWFAESSFSAIIGIDEAGRGAIAGPVAVGVHAVLPGTTEIPAGLRDSKLLSEARREHVHPLVCEWGPGAVGFGTADEVDQQGITRMLGVSARRALLELHAAGIDVERALIVVDGSSDWLTPVLQQPLNVVTRVGADRALACVAAASIRAKVERDRLMAQLHEELPHYGWASNKGYGAAAHYAAIAEHGASKHHRHSWLAGAGTSKAVG